MNSEHEFKSRTYERLYRYFNLPPYLRLITINFARPWWLIIWQQRVLFAFVIANEILFQTWDSLVPIMIAYALEQQSIPLLIAIISGWSIIAIINYGASRVNTKFQTQAIHSIFYSAHRQLLQADPLQHSSKSTGAIIAKIERTSKAYEEILDILSFEVLPLVISCSTMVVVFLTLNVGLAIAASLGILLIGLWSTIGFIFAAQIATPVKIQREDAAKAVAVENLTQHNLIRSCFASVEADAKLKHLTQEAMYAEGTTWRIGHAVNMVSRVLYYIVFGCVTLYFILQIKQGALGVLVATSIIASFLRSTQEIVRIGRKFYSIAKQVQIINDLFTFMRGFAYSSYPVLAAHETKLDVKQQDPIRIVAHDLEFHYPGQPPLFSNNDFELIVPRSSQNKLYGIIGQSGTGKSTFIAMLGGQLKPSKGTVTINGVDIYNVDDTVRRQLIGLQQQTASSMRGTIRQSLLFGLPNTTTCYTDEQLVQVLINVGLWHVLEAKNGLDTFIGESGLTLSGGQRQRLNFASLYLRARYYRPILILIDEPTSSLDRVSESAITGMIDELAANAVVLVIAHRLNTIATAAGLIDFSLLPLHKQLIVRPAQELEKISPYYQHLVHAQ